MLYLTCSRGNKIKRKGCRTMSDIFTELLRRNFRNGRMLKPSDSSISAGEFLRSF